MDHDDCVNLVVKLADEKSLQAWVDQPEHDYLIQKLDKYRSRNYMEAAKIVSAEKPIWNKFLRETKLESI